MARNGKKAAKDPYPRHLRLWRFCYAIAHRYVEHKFNITHDEQDVEGPIILVPNHVTNWDPLIVGMSLRKKHCYFVATEHILRLGFLSKVLNFVFGPIPRPKGGSSLDSIRKIVDHVKRGHSICLFAEGEATWDGKSQPIFPATGKLIRLSGATLVTFRIEGGYLSLPRWNNGQRRGAVHSHVVHIYRPDQLKKMSPQEINDAIETDIFEDAFARQTAEPVAYRGKTPAEKLESLLYYCPACKKLGTLRSERELLSCSCGFRTRFTENGFFAPEEPFKTVYEWAHWQQEEMNKRCETVLKDHVSQRDEALFSDDMLRFNRVTVTHETILLGTVRLTQYPDRITLGGQAFQLSGITDMAMVQECRLLFTAEGTYYEVLSEKHSGVNLKKYLDYFHCVQAVRSQI